MSDNLSSLREHFELTEEDWNREISDSHLDEISLNYCTCWKMLPSQLELKPIVVNDIDKAALTETEKRLEFFRQWKKKKGFNATYKKLVMALLKIEQRQDAGSVCKLLKQSSQESVQRQTSNGSEANSDPSCPPRDPPFDLTPYFPHLPAGSEIPEEELSLLKEQLYQRLYHETNKIKSDFASLMFDVQKDLEKRLDIDDLIDFLIFHDNNFETLISDCTRIGQVFRKVRRFVSFFDYDLLETLISKFGSEAIAAKLMEYEELFERFSKRRVVECPSNAFGESEASERVVMLIADKSIESLTLDELKKFKYRVNKILDSKLIKILRVEGGSIKITFRTFEIDTLCITEEQQKALKEEGVISISYGDQFIDISPITNPQETALAEKMFVELGLDEEGLDKIYLRRHVLAAMPVEPEDESSPEEDFEDLDLSAPPLESWYHGRITRQTAHKRLKLVGEPGGYLVRESIRQPGDYAISYLSRTGYLHHFKINSNCGDYYIGGRQFFSLNDLIGFYANCSCILESESLEAPIIPPKPVPLYAMLRATTSHTKAPRTDELTIERGEVFLLQSRLNYEWGWGRSQKSELSGLIPITIMEELTNEDSNLGKPWFYESIGREEAVDLLMKNGTPGSFLVRKSTSRGGEDEIHYSMAIRTPETVHRFLITKYISGYYVFGGRPYSSMEDVIERYRNELILEGLKLGSPLPKESETVESPPSSNELGSSENRQIGEPKPSSETAETESSKEKIEDSETTESSSQSRSTEMEPERVTTIESEYQLPCELKNPQKEPLQDTLPQQMETHGKQTETKVQESPVVPQSTPAAKVESGISGGQQIEDMNVVSPSSRSPLTRMDQQLSEIAPRQDVPGDFTGILSLKRGKKSPVYGKWRVFYFVVKLNERKLLYFEQESRHRAKGLLNLRQCKVYEVHPSLFGPNCIVLMLKYLNETTFYYLSAGATGDIQEWWRVLRHCTHPGEEQKEIQQTRSLNLVIKDCKLAKSSSQVYSLVFIDGACVARTRVMSEAICIFDEEFCFDNLPSNATEFSCEVHTTRPKRLGNIAAAARESCIGRLKVDLSDLPNGQRDDRLHQLMLGSSKVSKGSIKISALFKDYVILPVKEYNQLKELVLSDDLKVIEVLAKVCKDHRAELASTLLQIFSTYDRLVPLINACLAKSVDNEENVSALFRTSTLSTMLMDQYMKLTALDYLRSILRAPVRQIMECPDSCEVNLSIFPPGADLTSHQNRLQAHVTHVLMVIFSSVEQCPPSLRYVYHCLQEKVSQKWPGDESVRIKAISGFLFSRFICPALLKPQLFDIVSDPPTPTADRTLKLVAKTVQNLARLVVFKRREAAFMVFLNPFITKNMHHMKLFINQISTWDQPPQEPGLGAIDPARDLSTISHICHIYSDSLRRLAKTTPNLLDAMATLQKAERKYATVC